MPSRLRCSLVRHCRGNSRRTSCPAVASPARRATGRCHDVDPDRRDAVERLGPSTQPAVEVRQVSPARSALPSSDFIWVYVRAVAPANRSNQPPMLSAGAVTAAASSWKDMSFQYWSRSGCAIQSDCQELSSAKRS